jgi:cysteine desulfuration protein SufE|tara:strand:- start:818 stop:1228 length:411 start_codon:yes stop_codon:yes gene_type:complete
MSWNPALQEIIDEFVDIDDQFEKLEVLIEFADQVNHLPLEEWSDDNLVKGCQSIAHLQVEIREGTIFLMAAADAKLVQGLQGILTVAVQGLSPQNALELTPDFAVEMGLLNTLTPSRSNGFRNMFDTIQTKIKEMI